MPASPKLTLAHVTHEAVEQIGGIGAVLEGLIISPVYQQHVKRSILVGPTATHMSTDPEARLGEHGKVLYSSIDNIDRVGIGTRLRPVEWAFDVKIVYGTRQYNPPGHGRTGEAEVLLIDVFHCNRDRLNLFKFKLFERFGIPSGEYEKHWDYEEYVRIASPALYALRALMREEDLPCVLFAHEFMGMPAALAAILDGQKDFRTVFHAHECATARRLVEDHPGHDTMFYNVLGQAMAQGQYVEDVFGSQSSMFRHALVSRSYLCDGVIAVGDHTASELKFLSNHFDNEPVDIVYNGLPAMEVTLKSKLESRQMLLQYSEAILGWKPDVLMTHVTRPVISKGLWRDLKVCHEMEPLLKAEGRKAVLYILTSAGGVRRAQDVASMEKHYNWPRQHRHGYPDLVGPEVDLDRDIQAFNRSHEHVQVVLVNQFGWTQSRIGARLPKDMHMTDLRFATDVEFGMATYEPFGISPLEPLGAGAVCVITNVCGCAGFVQHVCAGKPTPNVLIADFTQLETKRSIKDLLQMTRTQRDAVEARVSAEVARDLVQRIPKTDKQREALIKSGQALVARMGWDAVASEKLIPMLERIRKMPVTNGNGHATMPR